MITHAVRAHRSKDHLKREDQLAWKFAELAADPVEVDAEATDMIINRIIDNASVAIASLNRSPIKSARAMAYAHARKGGATLFGAPADETVCAEWAAWANGTAVRELDFHDTFLAADYSHPGDNIPPVLAVAQQMGKDGRALVRGDRDGVRDSGQPRESDLPPRTQDRPYRAYRPVGVGGGRHAPWSADGDYLSGGAAGAPHDDHDAPVAEGRDFKLEGVRAGLCRRSRRSRRSTAA